MRSALRPIAPIAFGIAVAMQAAALAVHAAGTVQVSYVQPDRFIDAGQRPSDVEDTLSELTRHFELLAKRHLPDGQALRIEVLEIDLAGSTHPWRHAAQDIRLLKGGADWPRIQLRYTLESTSLGPRKAELWVADMGYLQRIGGRYASESLGYEKRMLAEWFSAEFGAAGAR